MLQNLKLTGGLNTSFLKLTEIHEFSEFLFFIIDLVSFFKKVLHSKHKCPC